MSVGMDMSCGGWMANSVCWYGHNSIDQWAMENSVCCYGHVLWRVDGKQYQLLWTCVVEGGW